MLCNRGLSWASMRGRRLVISLLPYISKSFHHKCDHSQKIVLNNSFRDVIAFHSIRQICQSSISAKCWKCLNVVDNMLFCNSCNRIQKPPATIDYYALLNLPQRFDIDTEKLAKSFKNLQKLLHPDKFSSKSTEELEIAQNWSSFVNKAYTTLLSPESRGFYMLEQKGVFLDENTSIDQQDLLQMLMERNEDVEEASTTDGLRKVELRNQADIDGCLKVISKAFYLNNLPLAKHELIRLKYLNNVSEKIKDKRIELIVTK